MHGLTLKQQRFAEKVAAGLSASEAYRQSYIAGAMSPHSVWVEAGRLMRHPAVARRIEQLLAEMERNEYVEAGHLRALVVEKLKHEALNARSGSTRVAALVWLGKTVGLFSDGGESRPKDGRSAIELRRELENRLRQLSRRDLAQDGAEAGDGCR